MLEDSCRKCQKMSENVKNGDVGTRGKWKTVKCIGTRVLLAGYLVHWRLLCMEYVASWHMVDVPAGGIHRRVRTTVWVPTVPCTHIRGSARSSMGSAWSSMGSAWSSMGSGLDIQLVGRFWTSNWWVDSGHPIGGFFVSNLR